MSIWIIISIYKYNNKYLISLLYKNAQRLYENGNRQFSQG